VPNLLVTLSLSKGRDGGMDAGVLRVGHGRRSEPIGKGSVASFEPAGSPVSV
jgi:hypothetical protein